jgi:hypothetical protein
MNEPVPQSGNLFVVWSSADPEVARKLVFMYTRNSMIRNWWGRVRLIVWGPSAKLLAEDDELQDEIIGVAKDGVELLACKRCADEFGVTEKLEALGIEVIYMGVPMTEMLKTGWRQLTF